MSRLKLLAVHSQPVHVGLVTPLMVRFLQTRPSSQGREPLTHNDQTQQKFTTQYTQTAIQLLYQSVTVGHQYSATLALRNML